MPTPDLDALIAAQIELEKGNSKGGNKGFTCLHCEVRYFGSRSRQLAHLLGIRGKGVAACKKISLEDKAVLLQAYNGTSEALEAEDEPGSSSRPESRTGMDMSKSRGCAVPCCLADIPYNDVLVQALLRINHKRGSSSRT